MYNTVDRTPSDNIMFSGYIPMILQRDSLPESDLIEAVLDENLKCVQHLSARNVLIPVADSWVIYQAYLKGLDMMHALSMNPECNPNRVIPNEMGDRIIHFILRASSERFSGTKIGAVSFLMENGAHPVWQRDRQGNAALHLLAESSTHSDAEDLDIIRALLNENEKSFIPKPIRDACLSGIDIRNIPQEEGEGYTPLMTAVMCNNVGCVQILLEHGAGPHIVGPFFQTPLNFAISKNFVEVA